MTSMTISEVNQQLKIALPKGRLLPETAILLNRASWGLSEYYEGTRSYRLKSARFPGLLAKIFHEKDVPIQVAVGNYDLGICGLDWTEELVTKYPSSAIIKLRELGYGESTLYVVTSRSQGERAIAGIKAKSGTVRIASEYPNLAESFALDRRLKRFSVFPLWGAAEVYPPESADLAMISGSTGASAFNHDLIAIGKVLSSSACLIANRNSWESKDLSEVLASIESAIAPKAPGDTRVSQPTPQPPVTLCDCPPWAAEGTVRIALADGHQQKPTVELLQKAGIEIDDYPSKTGNRRPVARMPGVRVKVIRPQDMPLQVASGNFDLAITGRDWVLEHLYQFPSSPVRELLDLKFGWVRIVAAVRDELAVTDASGLRQLCAKQTRPVRVASEYVNIADKFAHDNHLGMYRVIPTWGASEAFLPEDADLLIENTQTGKTLAQHNLRIIDTLFESTACLIGHQDSRNSLLSCMFWYPPDSEL